METNNPARQAAINDELGRLDWESNFRPDILVPSKDSLAEPKPEGVASPKKPVTNDSFPERRGRGRLEATSRIHGPVRMSQF